MSNDRNAAINMAKNMTPLSSIFSVCIAFSKVAREDNEETEIDTRVIQSIVGGPAVKLEVKDEVDLVKGVMLKLKNEGALPDPKDNWEFTGHSVICLSKMFNMTMKGNLDGDIEIRTGGFPKI